MWSQLFCLAGCRACAAAPPGNAFVVGMQRNVMCACQPSGPVTSYTVGYSPTLVFLLPFRRRWISNVSAGRQRAHLGARQQRGARRCSLMMLHTGSSYCCSGRWGTACTPGLSTTSHLPAGHSGCSLPSSAHLLPANHCPPAGHSRAGRPQPAALPDGLPVQCGAPLPRGSPAAAAGQRRRLSSDAPVAWEAALLAPS